MKTLLSVILILQLSFCFGQGNSNDQFEEIIVRLNHHMLKREVIEDHQQREFPLQQVLNSKGKEHMQKVDVPGLMSFPTRKVFPWMSWKDSVSKTIDGRDIAVPPFWATFVMKVPKAVGSCKVMERLEKKPEIVVFSHHNFRVEGLSVPNDPLYDRQEGLNGNALLPNAGINIEEAWDIETGEAFVKVGVLDSGIDSTNADLDVLFGGPYYDENHVTDFLGYGVDREGHGTQVAAIIGAKRNNGIGTAGIAGGNNADEKGVSLIDLRYPFNSNSGAAYICAATVDAARTVGSYWDYGDFFGGNYFKKTPGFGVQIQNNSYLIQTDVPKRCENTGNPNVSIPNEPVLEEISCNLCREAFLYSYRSGVINVVARGNRNVLSDEQDPTYVATHYPQNFPDSWIISVGASGYDGNTVQEGVNQSISEQQSGFYSLYGGNMDLIAPGSDSIVYGPLPSHFDKEYRGFNGTSAAAPHVSGVVALLLSHYNKNCYSQKNLAIEDVEFILESSATDVLEPGFDVISGAGRLNAGAALNMIKDPTKQIIHPQKLVSSLEIERDTIALKYGEAFVGTNWGPISTDFPLIQANNYQVERVLYENTYDYSEYMSPAAQVAAYWPRPSASNAVKYYADTTSQPGSIGIGGKLYIYDNFDMTPEAKITELNSINQLIKTRGYYYHFINVYIEDFFIINTNKEINVWLPNNPSETDLNIPVSIYILDSTQTMWHDFPCDSESILWDSTWTPFDGVGIEESENMQVHYYPNPTKDELNINFGRLSGEKQIELYDLNGKKLEIWTGSGDESIISLSKWSHGLYIIRVKNGNKTFYQKILKQ